MPAAKRPAKSKAAALEGRRRAVIEGVRPELDGGRWPIKRVVGERVLVEADVFVDGHDEAAARLLFRKEGGLSWSEAPMEPLGNDRWRGSFVPDAQGRWSYTLRAWADPFAAWRKDLAKRLEAGQDVAVELEAGAALVEAAARRAKGEEAERLGALAEELRASGAAGAQAALGEELAGLMARHPDRSLETAYPRELAVQVDRERARSGAWYELFPRSCAQAGRHGTFRDVERRLSYVAGLGFDVLYLPPVHPIGRSFRKGRNNAVECEPGEPGSPWAIGSEEGGHDALHPELGTLEDFRRLVARAREFGLEVAMDLAFQCSPDHPWVKSHPGWFKWRPDGTIRYAENPPKKYQDIYPLDFESADWKGLWKELLRVTLHWAGQGVRLFRVDNPHTKPFAFWEWLIAEVKKEQPDVLFLSEAFTRPKVMQRLAKLGFTQSYNYFPWRNGKDELTAYFTELTRTELAEYFRPNLWPNTPDILTEYLQSGGRPAFMARAALAAGLGASWGIYGPAFELCEGRPREPGSEEYLDSEKYELKAWDLDRSDGIGPFIARLNAARRAHPALRSDRGLAFHRADNDALLCWSKKDEGGSDVVLAVVNLDPHHVREGFLELDLGELGLAPEAEFQVHDLLDDSRYLWRGARNYVRLDPRVSPAHLFAVRRKARSERDFDTFQ